MRIALVQCPGYTMRLPHLGLAYLSAALKDAGHEVMIFDFNVDLYPAYPYMWEEFSHPRWLEADFFMDKQEFDIWTNRFSSRITEYQPDVVGFSLQSSSVVFTLKVANMVKEKLKDAFIVFGGPECLREKPEFFFHKSPVDCIVQGEGEQTLVELLKIRQSQGSLNACNGIIFRSGKELVMNPPRAPQDINKLPIPDFSLFKRDKYISKDMLPMLTSKGCINKCVFCVDTWYQNKYVFRDADLLVKEMIFLREKYAVTVLAFNDLLLNGNLKNLERMCDLIIQNNLDKVSWHGNFFARKMSRSLILKLRRAGLRGATFGLESASPRLLKLMNKNIDLAAASFVIKEFFRAGIVVNINWIVGFPGGDRKDLIKSAKFLFRHRKYILELGSFNIMAINPPSIIFKDIDKLKIIMGKSAVDWKLGMNSLEERSNHLEIFKRFGCGIYQLSPRSGFFAYLAARKLLKTFIKELYH